MASVGIYLRISDDRDGDQKATGRQRADCTKFAKSHGWKVADVFEDIDTSAFKRTVKRPEFERMLEAVRTKQIDGVLAWKIDRITRRQRDLVRLDEACEDAGGFIATVVEGIDTRQPTGRFVAELLVAQARMESENMRTRITRKHDEMAAAGTPSLGGTRMYGYSIDRMKIVPTEAKLIREAVKRVYDGAAIRTICNDWKARGIVTPTGKAWQQHPLKRMLIAAALSGQREHKGVLTPGTWPAILTREDTTKLRAILNDPRRIKNKGNGQRNLLSGMMRCGICGGALVARPRLDHVRRYVCAKQPGNSNCGKIARLAEPVEDLVKEAVCVALDGADLRAFVQGPAEHAADLIAAITADEETLEQLSRDHYAEKRIGRAEFLAARDAVSIRLEENRTQRAKAHASGALSGLIGAGDEVRRRWDKHDIDWQRSVVSAVVDTAVLDPARRGYNRFDPKLVRIVWKF